MKMPKDVELATWHANPNVVRFSTKCGIVSGTAYRASGQYETHYDVVEAMKLAWRSGSPSIIQKAGEVGCFEVVGQVTFFFDDGVFTAAAHGFDFWVEPDQLDTPVQLGDWVRLQICNFTLYV